MFHILLPLLSLAKNNGFEGERSDGGHHCWSWEGGGGGGWDGGDEKYDGTHKLRKGVNWFLYQIKLKKTRVKKKTSFPRIVSQTFDKPIFNQSPLTQNLC